MLCRLIVIISILVNTIFGANYQHQPFSNDAKVEYLPIDLIEPIYEPHNGLYYRQFTTKSSKSTVDGVVLVPSIPYSENRFYTGNKASNGFKEQILLRSFLDGEDQSLYFTMQGENESYFYSSAFNISCFFCLTSFLAALMFVNVPNKPLDFITSIKGFGLPGFISNIAYLLIVDNCAPTAVPANAPTAPLAKRSLRLAIL